MLITNLHIEASSYCNARCPGCPRNAYGYPLTGFFEEKHLDVIKYAGILDVYRDVKSILFCGNHGDPMMHPSIAGFCDKNGVNFTIATNGGIGRLETYKDLATKNLKIVFGIDGLEDTNHLYRQGVKWENVMDRAKTFIDAGGTAEWQFIKFKHNMEQVEEARELSQQLGFDNFFTLDAGRNNMPAIQSDKSISHWILPPDENAQPQDFDVDAYLNMRYKPQNLGKSTCKVSKISCEHLGGSVYVNSLGQLFPCCYHGFGHVDRPKVLLEKFADLKKTWTTDYCDEICAGSCGAP
jgi:MoaA/NifB/PqqE/SkfB family radical SAM enzyme|tara:strand:+ start:497 stop:1381 length:885 start_codon:yes stop_codon:yes gene_type:complete